MSKFKVLSMGRVGTMAINRFLNDHPQIQLPSFTDCSKVFKSSSASIGDLLTDTTQKTMSQGLVIHDSLVLDKQYRKQITKLNNVKTDLLIHMVRNPLEQVKSWINHINACACMGIMGWEKIPTTAEAYYNRYPLDFQTVMPGLQCRNFYKNCKKVLLINFPQISTSNIENTMETLYGQLGVDPSYKSPMLHSIQNNYTRQLLRAGIQFELNGEVIEMGMAPVDLFFHYDKNAKPWVTLHDTHKIFALCPSLPKLDGDLVFMPKDFAAANKLSFKTRKMLHEGIKDIVGELMPVWAKRAEKIAQQIEENKLHNLSDTDKNFIEIMIKEDLKIFGAYHPEFKPNWEISI